MRVERLSPGDIVNLSVERRGGRPFHIGALITFASDAFPDGLSIDLMRSALAARLDDVPRLRQIIRRARFGFGRPYWVDAQAFDIAHHVFVRKLTSTAHEPTLLRAVEGLNEGLIDRTRPLWELWFLTGPPGEPVAAFFKIHHVVADGIAGVALLMSLLDLAPDAVRRPAVPWAPRPAPSRTDLVRDRMQLLRARVGRMGHPIEAVRRWVASLPAVREGVGGQRAPRMSFNRVIGRRREFHLVRTRLEDVRAAAHGGGGTVNDVLLAAAGGGIRALLEGRRERTDGIKIRISVPVSLHSSEDAVGNRTSIMVVPVDVGEADPVRRLTQVVAETNERKQRLRPELMSGLLASRFAQRAFIAYADRQRMVNLFVTNVPGPPVALYLAGAQLKEMFPVVPLGGNVSVSIAILSYAGGLYVTVVADPDVMPDADVIAGGFEQTVRELIARLGPARSAA